MGIRLFLQVAALVATMGGFTANTPAFAGTVDCSQLTRTACDAAIAALKRAPYRGPVRPASEPMACARVVSYGPKPVVWVDRSGLSLNHWRNGRVIADTGVVHTERFSLNGNWIVTESCIPRRLLSDVTALTLCTGLYQEGFHWNVSQSSLAGYKRIGHSGYYHPFLTHSDRGALQPRQVRGAYRARYGI